MDFEIERKFLVDVGRYLYAKGFVAANDGNLSVKVGSDCFLVTPTGVSKGFMKKSDMVLINAEGKVIEGKKKPTSEIRMHLSVYRTRPDVNAVIHAHPAFATACAITDVDFDKIALPEAVFSLGRIAFAEYATPSTEELPEAVKKVVGHSDALILKNHGALTCGEDIHKAYYKMETLEHFCKIIYIAKGMGKINYLSEEQLKRLFEIRSEVYGQSNEIFK